MKSARKRSKQAANYETEYILFSLLTRARSVILLSGVVHLCTDTVPNESMSHDQRQSIIVRTS